MSDDHALDERDTNIWLPCLSHECPTPFRGVIQRLCETSLEAVVVDSVEGARRVVLAIGKVRPYMMDVVHSCSCARVELDGARCILSIHPGRFAAEMRELGVLRGECGLAAYMRFLILHEGARVCTTRPVPSCGQEKTFDFMRRVEAHIARSAHVCALPRRVRLARTRFEFDIDGARFISIGASDGPSEAEEKVVPLRGGIVCCATHSVLAHAAVDTITRGAPDQVTLLITSARRIPAWCGRLQGAARGGATILHLWSLRHAHDLSLAALRGANVVITTAAFLASKSYCEMALGAAPSDAMASMHNDMPKCDRYCLFGLLRRIRARVTAPVLELLDWHRIVIDTHHGDGASALPLSVAHQLRGTCVWVLTHDARTVDMTLSLVVLLGGAVASRNPNAADHVLRVCMHEAHATSAHVRSNDLLPEAIWMTDLQEGRPRKALCPPSCRIAPTPYTLRLCRRAVGLLVLVHVAPGRRMANRIQSIRDDVRHTRARIAASLLGDALCAVCMEGDSCVITACGHTFCYLCIETLLRRNHTACPLCRDHVIHRHSLTFPQRALPSAVRQTLHRLIRAPGRAIVTSSSMDRLRTLRTQLRYCHVQTHCMIGNADTQIRNLRAFQTHVGVLLMHVVEPYDRASLTFLPRTDVAASSATD